MQNHEIVELYKDKAFKDTFVTNYTNAKATANSNWTKTEAEYQWNVVFKLLADAYTNPQLTPIHLGNIKDLRDCMAYVSEAGLSFEPSQSEAYLVLEYLNNHPVIKTRLGYKGMTRIAMASGLFKYIFVELVRNGDTFKWFGSSIAPEFSSPGKIGEKVVLGYVGFKYIDGDCLYIKVDGTELQEIENASKAYSQITKGTDEDNIYNTAWKDRMYEIAVWRTAYNRMRQIVSFGTLKSRAPVDEKCNVILKPESTSFMSTFGHVDS